jgi:LCP family protein required for cell wall assembly
MFEITQPTRRLDTFQPVRVKVKPKPRKKRARVLVLLGLIFVYFVAPLRTNILFLGTDDSPERGSAGRTDTIILATVVPLKPYIGMMSIPRDLWVNVEGVGEQRINTAYFFSEANQPGSGADAAMGTIRENFDVPVRYYMVIHMLGLTSVIDALGGVDIQLDAPMSGMSAGAHHLNGIQALAFARDRSSSDDFGRMYRAQVLISGVIGEVAAPGSWRNLPRFIMALSQTVETNIPVWQIPRLLFALVRVPIFGGVKSETITREMVTPFVTSGGAQVLLPDWEAIHPLLKEMFGR